jgi:hypothetical protein
MAVRLLDLQLIYGVAGAREKFQELVASLIQNEHPAARVIRVVVGDAGVDVYVGDWTDPAGIDVFQTKFFPNGLTDSQKAQIRESFNSTALSHQSALPRLPKFGRVLLRISQC